MISQLIRKMSNKKTNLTKYAASKQPNPDSKISGPISLNKNGDIRILILAKPGSKLNCITDISDEGCSIQIAAPPIDGEANTELVRYIAQVLKLRKSDVSLDRGSKCRNKIIVVSKEALTLERCIDLLGQEIDLK